MTKNTGVGCLTVFGLVFLIAGLSVAAMGLSTVYKSARAQSWEAAEAIIQTAELDISYSDDSTTYRASGLYSYQWQGQTYRSDKVFFSLGSDSNEKYHRKIVREMKSHQSSGQPMPVWVNPKKPDQSVLYRHVRWGHLGFLLIFGAAFGVAGAGIMAMARYGGKTMEREAQRQELYPKEPWRWRDEWQSSEIRNSNGAGLWFIFGFALLWNLISAPILFIVPGEVIDKNNTPALIGLLFPIVGVGLGFWAYTSYRSWRRFKEAVFHLDTYPVALGHVLKGSLVLREQLPDDTVFKTTLNAVKRYETGSGEDRETREDILWQDEQDIPIKAGRYKDKFRLPIQFKIPADQTPTSVGNNNVDYIWRLSFRSKLDGADLTQDFEIPVFEPSEFGLSVPELTAMETVSANTDVYIDQGDWKNTGVIFNGHISGNSYYFPPARHKILAFSTSVIAAIFTGIGLLPLVVDMPWFIAIFFLLFGVLIIWIAVNMWLYKTEIAVSPTELTVRKGLFAGKYETVDPGHVRKLDISSTMTAGSTKYYDIFAHLVSGRKIKLAIHLLGRRDTQALVDKISSDLGLEKTK